MYSQIDRTAFADVFPFKPIVPIVAEMFQAYEEIGCAYLSMSDCACAHGVWFRLRSEGALERGYIGKETEIVAAVHRIDTKGRFSGRDKACIVGVKRKGHLFIDAFLAFNNSRRILIYSVRRMRAASIISAAARYLYYNLYETVQFNLRNLQFSGWGVIASSACPGQSKYH